MNENIRRFLFSLYYFFVLCPFVSPVYMPVDVKPFCMILAFVILVLYPEKIIVSSFFVHMLFIVIISTVIFIFQLVLISAGKNGDIFLAARKAANYISLFVISLTGFNIFVQQDGINEAVVKRMIILWTVAGIAELIYPQLMQIVTPGARTTISRGVTGLAMEPSFYGYMAFFFLIFALDFKTERIKYSALTLLQIILLAKSPVAVLYVLLLLASYILLEMNLMKKFLLISAIILSITIFLQLAKNSERLMQYRIVYIFVRFSENIDTFSSMEKIYKMDISVADRINAVTWSLGDFFSDMGFPHGFIYDGRIISGYGATLYELGILGLLMLYIITRRFNFAFKPYTTLSLSAVLFSAVQISLPTFAFIIAIAEYKFYAIKKDPDLIRSL